jgi:transcriptional regulator with GAF, ATPase, and Fis domain
MLKARVLSDRLSRPGAFADIVTISPAMRSIFQYVEAVAPSPRPVLITGETGVGKSSWPGPCTC